MDQDPDVHLRWNHHQTTLLSVFSSLLGNENLVDCTISAEGQCFKAHRVILSACSPYFELIFSEHCELHPIIILPDVQFQVLKVLVEYMYSGEVKVPQNKLCTVLELAEALQIKGLSVTSESEMKDSVGLKGRNQSSSLYDQQSFKKHISKHTYCSQVKQKEDVLPLNTSVKDYFEDTDFRLLTAQACDKNSSNSIFCAKPIEGPAMSQSYIDFETFNVFSSSSLKKTMNKSNTRVSEAPLDSVSNILDSSLLPVSSKKTTGEQGILSENMPLMCSSSEELRTSGPLGMNGKGPLVNLAPEIKQENPDDFKCNSVEEIIIDDDTDENDDFDNGSGDDNSGTVRGSDIMEESFSGQGFCSVEQYRDADFVEPAPLLSNRFKCDTCGRSYKYRKDLWRHLKYECGKEPQFWCHQCPGRRFFQKANLKSHIARMHSAINRKVV